MKLHLPSGLRAALFACFAAFAGIGTTLSTATITGGVFAVALSGQAYADKTATNDTTTVSDETSIADGMEFSGAIGTFTKAANSNKFHDGTLTQWGTTADGEDVSLHWYDYCDGTNTSSVYGQTLRLTDASGSTIQTDFGPLTLGGLIVERSLTSVTLGRDGSNTELQLNSAQEGVDANIVLGANVTLQGHGLVVKSSGTWSIDSGKTLALATRGRATTIQTGKTVTIQKGSEGDDKALVTMNGALNLETSATVNINGGVGVTATGLAVVENSTLGIAANGALTLNGATSVAGALTNSGALTLNGATTLTQAIAIGEGGTVAYGSSFTLDVSGLTFTEANGVYSTSIFTGNVEGITLDTASVVLDADMSKGFSYANGVLSYTSVLTWQGTGLVWNETGTVMTGGSFAQGGAVTFNGNADVTLGGAINASMVGIVDGVSVTLTGNGNQLNCTNVRVEGSLIIKDNALAGNTRLYGDAGTVTYDIGTMSINQADQLQGFTGTIVIESGSVGVVPGYPGELVSHYDGIEVKDGGQCALGGWGQPNAFFKLAGDGVEGAQPGDAGYGALIMKSVAIYGGLELTADATIRSEAWSGGNGVNAPNGSTGNQTVISGTGNLTVYSTSAEAVFDVRGNIDLEGDLIVDGGSLIIGRNLREEYDDQVTYGLNVDNLIVKNGGIFRIAHAAADFSDVDITLDDGTFYWYQFSGSRIVSFGDLTVAGENSMIKSYSAGTLKIDTLTGSANLGIALENQHSAGQTTEFALVKDYHGTLSVASGNLTYYHLRLGTVDQAAGKEMIVTGRKVESTFFTKLGEGSLDARNGLETSASFSMQGGTLTTTTLTSNGTFTMQGGELTTSSTLTSNGTFTMLGGTLTSAALNVSGLLNMNYGGTLTPGTLTVADGTTLRYDSSTGKNLISIDTLAANAKVVVDVFDDLSAMEEENGINLGIATSVDKSQIDISSLGSAFTAANLKEYGGTWHLQGTAASVATDWDLNWKSGLSGQPAVDEMESATLPSNITYLAYTSTRDEGETDAISDDSFTWTPTAYLKDGVVAVTLTGTAEGATNVIVVGGAGSALTDDRSDAVSGWDYRNIATSGIAVTADTWINVTGGSYYLIVGGNFANNWGDGVSALAHFVGDSHIMLDGEGVSVDYIVGANWKDARDSLFNGSTYISVINGDVRGSIIGGGTMCHSNGPDVMGSTNVCVYTLLTNDSEVGGLNGVTPNAVIGGNLFCTNGGGTRMHIGGSTNILVDLAATASGNFEKSIVGGDYAAAGITSEILGSTNVTVTAPGTAAFTGDIMAGFYRNGNGGSVAISDGSHLTINGGNFDGAHVYGGAFLHENSGGTFTIAGTSTTMLTGGSFGSSEHNLAGGSLIGGASNAAQLTMGDIVVTTQQATGSTLDVQTTLYGGSVNWKGSDTGSTVKQGNITLNLESGKLSSVYAAGRQAGSATMTTASTTVVLGEDVTFYDNSTVSGAYNGSTNASVTGNRTLAFSGTSADLANVTLADFNVVDVREATANISLNQALSAIVGGAANVMTKAGAGTLSLGTADTEGTVQVAEGTLALNGHSLTAITVLGGAKLDASVAGSNGGALTLGAEAGDVVTLAVGNNGLAVGSLTLVDGAKMAVEHDVLEANYTYTLFTGLTADTINGIIFDTENGNVADLATYVSNAADFVDGQLILNEDGTLVVTNEGAGGTWYWTADAGTVWTQGDQSNTGWDNTTDSPADQKLVFANLETSTGENVVTIEGDVTPASVQVNATQDYVFSGTGSIASGTLEKSGAGTLRMETVNTTTDAMTINEGTVQLGVADDAATVDVNEAKVGSWAGSIAVNETGTLHVVNGGTSVASAITGGNAATIEVEAGNTLTNVTGGKLIANTTDTGTVTIGKDGGASFTSVENGTGTLNFSSDVTIGSLAANAGTIATGGNHITISSAVGDGGKIDATNAGNVGTGRVTLSDADNSNAAFVFSGIKAGTLAAGSHSVTLKGDSDITTVASDYTTTLNITGGKTGVHSSGWTKLAALALSETGSARVSCNGSLEIAGSLNTVDAAAGSTVLDDAGIAAAWSILVGTTGEGTVASGSGDATVVGNMTADNGYILVKGNATVSNTAKEGAKLGNMSSGNRYISIGGYADVDGNVTANQYISIGAYADVEGSLTSTSGKITIGTYADVEGSLTTGYTSDVDGGKAIEIGTYADVAGDLKATAAGVHIGGNATVGVFAEDGTVQTASDLFANWGVVVGGDAKVTRDLTAKNVVVSIGGAATVGGNVSAGTAVTITGAATITGDLTSGTNTADDAKNDSRDVTIGGLADIDGSLMSGGNVTLSKGGTIGKVVTSDDPAVDPVATGDLTVGGEGKLSLGGALKVYGTLSGVTRLEVADNLLPLADKAPLADVGSLTLGDSFTLAFTNRQGVLALGLDGNSALESENSYTIVTSGTALCTADTLSALLAKLTLEAPEEGGISLLADENSFVQDAVRYTFGVSDDMMSLVIKASYEGCDWKGDAAWDAAADWTNNALPDASSNVVFNGMGSSETISLDGALTDGKVSVLSLLVDTAKTTGDEHTQDGYIFTSTDAATVDTTSLHIASGYLTLGAQVSMGSATDALSDTIVDAAGALTVAEGASLYTAVLEVAVSAQELVDEVSGKTTTLGFHNAGTTVVSGALTAVSQDVDGNKTLLSVANTGSLTFGAGSEMGTITGAGTVTAMGNASIAALDGATSLTVQGDAQGEKESVVVSGAVTGDGSAASILAAESGASLQVWGDVSGVAKLKATSGTAEGSGSLLDLRSSNLTGTFAVEVGAGSEIQVHSATNLNVSSFSGTGQLVSNHKVTLTQMVTCDTTVKAASLDLSAASGSSFGGLKVDALTLDLSAVTVDQPLLTINKVDGVDGSGTLQTSHSQAQAISLTLTNVAAAVTSLVYDAAKDVDKLGYTDYTLIAAGTLGSTINLVALDETLTVGSAAANLQQYFALADVYAELVTDADNGAYVLRVWEDVNRAWDSSEPGWAGNENNNGGNVLDVAPGSATIDASLRVPTYEMFDSVVKVGVSSDYVLDLSTSTDAAADADVEAGKKLSAADDAAVGLLISNLNGTGNLTIKGDGATLADGADIDTIDRVTILANKLTLGEDGLAGTEDDLSYSGKLTLESVDAIAKSEAGAAVTAGSVELKSAVLTNEGTMTTEDVTLSGAGSELTNSGTLTTGDVTLNGANATLENTAGTLTAGKVTLNSATASLAAEGGATKVSSLNGTMGTVGGTIIVTGKGGDYSGDYDAIAGAPGATITLAGGASQTLAVDANLSVATLDTAVGTTPATADDLRADVTLAYDTNATMGTIDVSHANVTLTNMDADGNSLTLEVAPDSEMDGGSLAFGLKADDVANGVHGAAPVILKGQDMTITGTQLKVTQTDTKATSTFDVTKGTEGLTLFTLVEGGEANLTKENLDTSDFQDNFFNGYFFNRYFDMESLTVENGQVKADLVTDYFTKPLAQTENGTAGLKMLDAADLQVDILGNADKYEDLAGVIGALHEFRADGNKEAADRLASAVAGSGIASLGMALAGDVERQLKAIRNRTTTMGVDPAVVNEEMPYFNAWINAEGDHRSLDEDSTYAGYSLSSWGGTVGFDMDVTPSLTWGLALTAMYGDFTAESTDVVEGDMSAYYVSAFARAMSGAWVHTFVATAGLHQTDVSRTVSYGGGSYTTEGEAEGMSFGFLYEVARTFALNEDATACWQPVFNVAYRHTEVDGYTETGSDAALCVGDQSLDTVTFGLGARLQAVVGESIYNRTSVFEARALVKVDAGDRESEMDTALISASRAKSTVRSAEMDAFGIELGAGISIPVGMESGSIFMDGSIEFRGCYTSANGTLGYRVNF